VDTPRPSPRTNRTRRVLFSPSVLQAGNWRVVRHRPSDGAIDFEVPFCPRAG